MFDFFFFVYIKFQTIFLDNFFPKIKNIIFAKIPAIIFLFEVLLNTLEKAAASIAAYNPALNFCIKLFFFFGFTNNIVILSPLY